MNYISTIGKLSAKTIATLNEINHEKRLHTHGTIYRFSNAYLTLDVLSLGEYSYKEGHTWQLDTPTNSRCGNIDPEEAVKLILRTEWDKPDTGPRAHFARYDRNTSEYDVVTLDSVKMTIPISLGDKQLELTAFGQLTTVGKFIKLVKDCLARKTSVCDSLDMFYKLVRDFEAYLDISLSGDRFPNHEVVKLTNVKHMINKTMPHNTEVILLNKIVSGESNFTKDSEEIMNDLGKKHPFAVYVTGEDYILAVTCDSRADTEIARAQLSSYNVPKTYRKLVEVVYGSIFNVVSGDRQI